MQVGLGFWGSKTLLSAVELGLFTELAEHPAEARGRCGTASGCIRARPPTSSTRWWRSGSSSARRASTANAPATDLFLDRRKPSYVGGLLEMANARLYGFWGDLTEALRTGAPQNEAKGGEAPFFEALYADPARLRDFLRAMTGLSHPANVRIAERFPWDRYADLRRRRHRAGRPRRPDRASPTRT